MTMEKVDDCCFSIMALITVCVAIIIIRVLHILYMTGKPHRIKPQQPLSTLIVLGSGKSDLYKHENFTIFFPFNFLSKRRFLLFSLGISVHLIIFCDFKFRGTHSGNDESLGCIANGQVYPTVLHCCCDW